MPPSHAPIKAQHTTPHHILFTKVYSVAFLHLSITTKQTKAPLSQTKPTMAAIVVAPFAVEARDVADIEGRSLSADAPSSDAPAPSPDSSSSPSDAPSGSSSSDA